jgi:hypothetical protein
VDIVVGDRREQILGANAGSRIGSMITRPASARTSTVWSSDNLAASITTAGMRTEAPLPHFLIRTRICAPDRQHLKDRRPEVNAAPRRRNPAHRRR